jgi:hypothetical protein
MTKRIDEHESLKGLRWRPVGLTEAEQAETEALAKKNSTSTVV